MSGVKCFIENIILVKTLSDIVLLTLPHYEYDFPFLPLRK